MKGTPEELIIDFGLNAQPFGAPADSLKVIQRLVINYFTAKRLLAALSMSVQRHEAAFGVLASCIPVIIPWRSASELDAPFSPTPCSVFVALPLGKEDKLSRIDQVVLAT